MRPVDIETLLQFSVTTYAVPLPVDFVTPCALITRTGGGFISKVLNNHSISVDCYADTYGDAVELADTVAGELMEKEGTTEGGVQLFSVDCSLPYINPDPNNKQIPRVSFTATIICRNF